MEYPLVVLALIALALGLVPLVRATISERRKRTDVPKGPPR